MSLLSQILDLIQYIYLYIESIEVHVYYIMQDIGVIILLAGLIYTGRNIRLARKNLQHLEKTNRENNDLERRYILQARLIELSREWNSREFVLARNQADITLNSKEFKDSSVDIQKRLRTAARLNEWVPISMVAHFFVRLSYIQQDNQVETFKAALEFGEAADYWSPRILRAFRDDPEEKSLRDAVIELDKLYREVKQEVARSKKL